MHWCTDWEHMNQHAHPPSDVIASQDYGENEVNGMSVGYVWCAVGRAQYVCMCELRVCVCVLCTCVPDHEINGA